MTNTQFSREYNELIIDVVKNLHSAGTDRQIAARIIAIVSFSTDPKLVNEDHDFDQVLERVKALRSSNQHSRSSHQSSPQTGSSPQGSSGSGGWSNAWQSLKGSFSATTSAFASAPGNIANSFRNAYRNSPIGMISRLSRVSARGKRNLLRKQKHSTSKVGTGGNWQQRFRRAMGMPQQSAKAAQQSNCINLCPGSGQVVQGSGQGSGSGHASTGGGSENGGSSQVNDDSYFKWKRFVPEEKGMFGNAGSAIGLALGGAGGQIVGTVIGNFVTSMKDAVLQAHTFAVTLKETNRKTMYYNAAVTMSYVEADLISMFRNLRIAEATAPSTISLNRAISRNEAASEARNIFQGNMMNEWAQGKLGVATAFEKAFQPGMNVVNYIYNNVSPNGDMLGRVMEAYTTQLINMMMYTLGTMFFGAAYAPGKSLLDEILKWFKPAPGKNFARGPWETLITNPRGVHHTEAVHHQKMIQRRDRL